MQDLSQIQDNMRTGIQQHYILLDDLENRNRRNNIKIREIPESIEARSDPTSLENLKRVP